MVLLECASMKGAGFRDNSPKNGESLNRRCDTSHSAAADYRLIGATPPSDAAPLCARVEESTKVSVGLH